MMIIIGGVMVSWAAYLMGYSKAAAEIDEGSIRRQKEINQWL